MTRSITDEVGIILKTDNFNENESIPRYEKAIESLEALKKMGVLSESGSNLLPIEERYKSVYCNNKAF